MSCQCWTYMNWCKSTACQVEAGFPPSLCHVGHDQQVQRNSTSRANQASVWAVIKGSTFNLINHVYGIWIYGLCWFSLETWKGWKSGYQLCRNTLIILLLYILLYNCTYFYYYFYYYYYIWQINACFYVKIMYHQIMYHVQHIDKPHSRQQKPS